MCGVKRKRKVFSLKKKCDIIHDIEKGMTNKETAEIFRVAKKENETFLCTARHFIFYQINT